MNQSLSLTSLLHSTPLRLSVGLDRLLHMTERLLGPALIALVLLLTINMVDSHRLALLAASHSAAALAAPADDAEEATPLNPRMQAALDHVSRRYRVAGTTLVPVFRAAQEAALEYKLDPLLIIAVIGVESGFNPFAESPMGAQGLMQVIPRYHQDKVPVDAGEHPFLDPVTNVHIGAQVLREAIRTRGGLLAGLQQYAGSSDAEGAYASKVLAEKQRLEDAASGKRPAAITVARSE